MATRKMQLTDSQVATIERALALLVEHDSALAADCARMGEPCARHLEEQFRYQVIQAELLREIFRDYPQVNLTIED